MRVSVLNVSDRGGDQPKSQIIEILEETGSIALIDSGEIRGDMVDFGVNEKILRKQSLREKFQGRLGRLVQSKRVEGLLIVDVYNKGRTIQVVVLGPSGEQIQDVRRTIERSRLESEQAIDILQEIFPVLGPEVLSYREALERAQVDETLQQTPLSTQGDPSEDNAVVKEDPLQESDGGAPYFKRGIDLGVGYFFGSRVFLLEEVANNSPDFLDHDTPMSGIGVQLDAIALAFGERGSQSIGLRGAFSLGFFRTTSEVINAMGTETDARYQSDSVDIKGELIYRRMLGSRFHVGGFGGVQNFVVSISQTSLPDDETGQTYNNSRYTGTGYLAGRFGADAGLRISPSIRASVEGGVLPLFSADVSQALGESETTMGFFGGGRLKLNFTRNLFAQAVYVYSFFRPVFPNPPGMAAGGTINIDARAEGTDRVHNLQAVLGLSF